MNHKLLNNEVPDKEPQEVVPLNNETQDNEPQEVVPLNSETPDNEPQVELLNNKTVGN